MQWVAQVSWTTKDGSGGPGDPTVVMVYAPTAEEARERAATMLAVRPEQIVVTPT